MSKVNDSGFLSSRGRSSEPIASPESSKVVNSANSAGSSFSTPTKQPITSDARHSLREAPILSSIHGEDGQHGDSPSTPAQNVCTPSPTRSGRETSASPERKHQVSQNSLPDSITVGERNTPLKASQHSSPLDKSWSHAHANQPVANMTKPDDGACLIDLENDAESQLTPKYSRALEQLNPNTANSVPRKLPSHLPRPSKSWTNRPSSSHSVTGKENLPSSPTKGREELQTQSKCEFEMDDVSDPEADILGSELWMSCPKTVTQGLFRFTFGFSLHLSSDVDGSATKIIIPPLKLTAVGNIEACFSLKTDSQLAQISFQDSPSRKDQDVHNFSTSFDISEGMVIPLPCSLQGGNLDHVSLDKGGDSSDAETSDFSSPLGNSKHATETILADSITPPPTSPVGQGDTLDPILNFSSPAEKYNPESYSRENNIFGISFPQNTHTESQDLYQEIDEKEDDEWELSDGDMSIEHGALPAEKMVLSLLENVTKDLMYEWSVSSRVKRIGRSWILMYTAHCSLYWSNNWPGEKEENVRMLIVYGPGGQYSHSVKEQGPHINIYPEGDGEDDDDQAPTVIQISQLTADCTALTVNWQSVCKMKQKRSSLVKLVPRIDLRGEINDESDQISSNIFEDEQPVDEPTAAHEATPVEEKHMQSQESLLSRVCNTRNTVLLFVVLFLGLFYALNRSLFSMASMTTTMEQVAKQTPSPLQLQICASDVTRPSSPNAEHKCTNVEVRDEADVDKLVTEYINIHGLRLVGADEAQKDSKQEIPRKEETEETIHIDIMKHVHYLRDKIDLALGWRGKESAKDNDKPVEQHDVPLRSTS